MWLGLGLLLRGVWCVVGGGWCGNESGTCVGNM